MTRKEINERNRSISVDLDNGFTWEDAAEKYGMTKDAVRHVCIKLGIYRSGDLREERNRAADAKKARVLSLYDGKRTYVEIARELGLNITFVRQTCIAGRDIKKEKEDRKAKARELRKKGWNNTQISEELGISEALISKLCACIPVKNHGEASSSFKEAGKKAREKQFDTATAKYIGMIESRGFINARRIDNEHFVGVCPECGEEKTFFVNAMRHNKGFECQRCEKERTSEEAERRAEERERAQREREEKRKERILEKAALRESRKHKCAVCGKETYNKKYCCTECAKKAQNARHDARRRSKIKSALVDTDISLDKVYRRDNGVCHICGGVCDYDDFTVREGAFVAGNNFPSIDHVVPLSKGGKHAWDNVRLAHRWCNTKKSDSVGLV